MNVFFKGSIGHFPFICLLGGLLFADYSFGQLLHPSDNASVSEDVLERRWPNGVIPYIVTLERGTQYTEANFNWDNWWEVFTQGAVRFVKRTTEDPYIEVYINDTACRTGGLRGIKEAKGTDKILDKRTIKVTPNGGWCVNHELGHVIGLWHQQRHYNSEQCVIQENETPPQLPPSNFIGHYSTDSIMHYRERSADFIPQSWVNDPILCPKPTTALPSAFDVHYVKKMYGVNGEYLNHTDWCSGEGQRIFMGDFNGDDLDDLLCHAKEGGVHAGHRFIDYAQLNSRNVYGSGDWEYTSNIFCRAANRNLYVGDFDADGKDDLLCHDSGDGRRFIDYAIDHLTGTNKRLDSYCTGSGNRIYVGDYDGDRQDDMLCHIKSLGVVSIDFAIDGFNGEDWKSDRNGWCKKNSHSIIVGDFNADGRDDMICHDIGEGNRLIDYANRKGHFNGAEWSSKEMEPFCDDSNYSIYAADVDGNGQDDLICHDRYKGSISVDYASNEGFQIRNRSIVQGPHDFADWATKPGVQVITGDFNDDGSTDIGLLSRDATNGWNTLPIAYTNKNRRFRIENRSIGSFAHWATTPGVQVLTGDFNADGRTDVGLLSRTDENDWSTLPVAYTNEDGSFRIENRSIGSFARWATTPGVEVITGDFNADDSTDIGLVSRLKDNDWETLPIAYTNEDGSFQIENRSIGSFVRWATAPGVQVLTGDFNADERTDVALLSQFTGNNWDTLPVAYTNEDGSFRIENRSIGSFASWATAPGVQVITGDFNADERTDVGLVSRAEDNDWNTLPIAYTNEDGSFQIENRTIGSFARWATKPGVQMFTGDFNADGRTDVGLLSRDASNAWSTLPVAYSTADDSYAENRSIVSLRNGNFADWANWITNIGVQLITGDFDADGRTDVGLLSQWAGNGWNSLPIAYTPDDSSRNGGSKLWKANTFREISFCNAQDAHLLVGRLPKNNSVPQSDSLFCHNRATGHQAARYDFD
ncbi:MAG: FG-GAP-like repeat-containing protein [Gammaproteobacteria bacterium]|nr:FG-GAP-like repeat-containing protein [Gammaproteobacteria bacterium]